MGKGLDAAMQQFPWVLCLPLCLLSGDCSDTARLWGKEVRPSVYQGRVSGDGSDVPRRRAVSEVQLV